MRNLVNVFRMLLVVCILSVAVAAQSAPLTLLKSNNWDPNVKACLNELLTSVGKNSPGYNPTQRPYAVFDFDNTVSILDEFGYVPFDVDGARLLYQVISESYERRSVIFTTNVEFSRWGTVFADDKLAAAIVDRVVHHGRLVEFGGPSHRLEESLMLGKSGR